jgi:hypothetical protein
MARSLGGQLHIPPLSWKYSQIDAAFDRHMAKRSQVYLPGLRWLLVRFWDRALFRLENRSRACASDRHSPSEV